MKVISVPSSKSLWNRYQILASFADVSIQGRDPGLDVQVLQQALSHWHDTSQFELGQGGTSFRFFLARVSRLAGTWLVRADPVLLARPQGPLFDALRSLGVSVEIRPDGVELESQGWRQPPTKLVLDSRVSSQFASALLLSAIDLPFDFEFEVPQPSSVDYWRMTLNCFEVATGFRPEERHVRIPRNLKVTRGGSWTVETDWSSAWSVMGVRLAMSSRGSFEPFLVPGLAADSTQPDSRCVELLGLWGAQWEFSSRGLMVNHLPSRWRAVSSFDLGSAPDLFPVLAVVLALGDGKSRITGISNLVHKESNRIEEVRELLTQAGFDCGHDSESFWVEGNPLSPRTSFQFDAHRDHRMAMAAAVLQAGGWSVNLLGADSVRKSFPSFWEVMG
jgi:3-phosphoshikimate 1-carboxyvinyltransferase